MSIENVEVDVVTHLAANVVVLTANANVRRGPPMKATQKQGVPGSVPEECVFVLRTGGAKDVTYASELAATDDPTLFAGEDYPTVQIWIRSGVRDYDGGKTLADAVLRAISRKPPTGYFEAEVMGSAPDYIREDEENHHEWSINVTLKISR